MKFYGVGIAAAVLFLFGVAKAETISCTGQVDFYGELQNFTVTIDGTGIGQAYTPSKINRIEVSGASLEHPNVFTHAADYWDGHSAGMITAAGFAMSYEMNYGCMNNVVITTDFRGNTHAEGQTVGHLTQSQAVTCKTAEPTCAR